jgi:hypothetical protein
VGASVTPGVAAPTIGDDPAPPLEPVPAVWACAEVSFAAAAPADVVGVPDVDDDPTPPTTGEVDAEVPCVSLLTCCPPWCQSPSADALSATSATIDSGNMLPYAVQLLASKIAAHAMVHTAACTADMVQGRHQSDRRPRISPLPGWC